MRFYHPGGIHGSIGIWIILDLNCRAHPVHAHHYCGEWLCVRVMGLLPIATNCNAHLPSVALHRCCRTIASIARALLLAGAAAGVWLRSWWPRWTSTRMARCPMRSSATCGPRRRPSPPKVHIARTRTHIRSCAHNPHGLQASFRSCVRFERRGEAWEGRGLELARAHGAPFPAITALFAVSGVTVECHSSRVPCLALSADGWVCC